MPVNSNNDMIERGLENAAQLRAPIRLNSFLRWYKVDGAAIPRIDASRYKCQFGMLRSQTDVSPKPQPGRRVEEAGAPITGAGDHFCCGVVRPPPDLNRRRALEHARKSTRLEAFELVADEGELSVRNRDA